MVGRATTQSARLCDRSARKQTRLLETAALVTGHFDHAVAEFGVSRRSLSFLTGIILYVSGKDICVQPIFVNAIMGWRREVIESFAVGSEIERQVARQISVAHREHRCLHLCRNGASLGRNANRARIVISLVDVPTRKRKAPGLDACDRERRSCGLTGS